MAKAIGGEMKPKGEEKNREGEITHTKKFEKFGMVAISKPNKDTIDEVFTIVPKRNEGKKK